MSMAHTGTAPTIVSFKSITNPATLVYHIDLVLLAFLAAVVLLRSARPAARLWKLSEWTNGHILSYTSLRRSSTRRVQFNSEGGSKLTGDSHWSSAQRIDEKGVTPSYPPHISSCPRFLRGFLRVLNARFNPGVSVLEVMIIVIYIATLAFPAFYATNPFTDPIRYGWIGVSQLPFAFALGSKNNVIGLLLGVGYEKVHSHHHDILQSFS